MGKQSLGGFPKRLLFQQDPAPAAAQFRVSYTQPPPPLCRTQAWWHTLMHFAPWAPSSRDSAAAAGAHQQPSAPKMAESSGRPWAPVR